MIRYAIIKIMKSSIQYAGSKCDNNFLSLAPTSIRLSCVDCESSSVWEERLPLRRKQTTNPKGAEKNQRLVSLLRVTVVDVYVSCPYSMSILSMCLCEKLRVLCAWCEKCLFGFPFLCQFVALIRNLKTRLFQESSREKKILPKPPKRKKKHSTDSIISVDRRVGKTFVFDKKIQEFFTSELSNLNLRRDFYYFLHFLWKEKSSPLKENRAKEEVLAIFVIRGRFVYSFFA